MIIQQSYNYMNRSLVPKRRTKTHKASELKAVYNSISKYNQSTPLYLVSLSEERQSHMINIKEQALTLRDITEQLSNPDSELYTKKQIVSANPDAVTGSFRSNVSGELPDHITLKIDQLASEQINVGSYLASDERAISPGNYSFFMNTERGSLPFSISVSEQDTNETIQTGLAEQINGRHLDIEASVIKEGSDSALMLTSANTGVPSTPSSLYFSFEGDDASLIETYGLNHIQTYPDNARFFINGLVHSATSNHISINQVAEFDFHQTTDTDVMIDFSPDKNLLISQLANFQDAYNQLVSLSEQNQPKSIGSRNLYHDISGIVSQHEEELSSMGLTVDESHRLTLDESKVNNISYDSLKSLFGNNSPLHTAITNSINRLTLDPLAYIDRLIVTYPNTSEKQTATYTQSVYSGLMYNNYA